jgi:carboxymethylenebutenolidase
VHAFVVYPENKENSSAVVMIHENKGLNDWARSMADQVAGEGYIVIAPDLLSSFDEERQKTSDFSSPDDATQALYSLTQEDISSDLRAVADYAKTIDSFNGNLVSAGFCWG